MGKHLVLVLMLILLPLAVVTGCQQKVATIPTPPSNETTTTPIPPEGNLVVQNCSS